MPAHPKKILVVDDDRVTLLATGRKLSSLGYHVITAADPAGTISAVRSEKPDLVLLDVSFPPDVAHGGGVSWDGFLLVSWLRRMDEAKNTPIVMISMDDSPEQIKRARAVGAAGFFPKPINYEGLATVLVQLLGEPVADPA